METGCSSVAATAPRTIAHLMLPTFDWQIGSRLIPRTSPSSTSSVGVFRQEATCCFGQSSFDQQRLGLARIDGTCSNSQFGDIDPVKSQKFREGTAVNNRQGMQPMNRGNNATVLNVPQATNRDTELSLPIVLRDTRTRCFHIAHGQTEPLTYFAQSSVWRIQFVPLKLAATCSPH